MLFADKDKVKIVSGCPVTRASSGVIEFSPPLIAQIAGAVKDKIEWMVLLLGERSADGFHVKVSGFRVPQQRRTSGDVGMTEPMEGPGSTVGEDVVGVLHSHHSMGAFFSHTDNTELNPFFKSSIVVAQAGKSALGFNYKAEGKVVLPCGSVGKVDFTLAITGSDRWNAQPVHDRKQDGGMGDCDQLSEVVTEEATEIVRKQTTPEPCGLVCNYRTDKPAVFGEVGGEELLTQIRQMTTGYTFRDGHDNRGAISAGDASRPSTGWADKQREQLSRKERKRLKREGKLSARRDGLFGIDYSAERFELEDDARPYPAHRHASSVAFQLKDPCDMCQSDTTIGEAQYLYIGEATGYRAWMCGQCYDWCMSGWEEADVRDELDAADNVVDMTLPVATPVSLANHRFVGSTMMSDHGCCIFSFNGEVCGRLERDHGQQGRGEGKLSDECRQLDHTPAWEGGKMVCLTCRRAANATSEQAAQERRERLGISNRLLVPPTVH